MWTVLLQILTLTFAFFSCSQNDKAKDIKIKPLHPYFASPFYYKQGETQDRNYVIKYFFIEGAYEATDKLSKEVDSFIIKHIRTDTDFISFGSYRLQFYRETEVINEGFREQIDGMISYNLLDQYDKDLLFEYSWADNEFIGCSYYKDGEIIKTKYDKGDDILKRNPILPLPDTGKVKVKDLGNISRL